MPHKPSPLEACALLFGDPQALTLAAMPSLAWNSWRDAALILLSQGPLACREAMASAQRALEISQDPADHWAGALLSSLHALALGELDRAWQESSRASSCSHDLDLDHQALVAVLRGFILARIGAGDRSQLLLESALTAFQEYPVFSALASSLASIQPASRLDLSAARALDEHARALAAPYADSPLGILLDLRNASLLQTAGQSAAAAARARDLVQACQSRPWQLFLPMAGALLCQSTGIIRHGEQALAKAQAMGMALVERDLHHVLAPLQEARDTPKALRAALAHHHELERLEQAARDQGLYQMLARSECDAVTAESESYRQIAHQLTAISALGRELTTHYQRETILELVRKRILALIPAEAFGLALFNPSTKSLDYAFYLDGAQSLPAVSIPVETVNSLGAWCFQTGNDIHTGNIHQDWQRYLGTPAPEGGIDRHSLIFVPLECRGQRLGIVTVQHHSYNAFSLMDLDTLKALAAYLAIALDNAQLLERLSWRASFDQLTGLRNRASIIEKALDAFARFRRYQHPVSFLMIDIDHFKSVNDQFGHQTGDRILAEVARRLEFHLRDCDFVGRYGGEEFLAVLPDTDAPGAVTLAERIRFTCQDVPVDCGNDRWHTITLSIGVHAATSADRDSDDAINHADEALYWCKHHGRDQVKLWQAANND